MHADEHTIFDLIDTINDHRRVLDAVALGSGDAAHKAWYRQHSRLEAIAVARVRRGMSREGSRHRIPDHVLLGYVESLIDAYAGDGPDLVIPTGAGTRAQAQISDD